MCMHVVQTDVNFVEVHRSQINCVVHVTLLLKEAHVHDAEAHTARAACFGFLWLQQLCVVGVAGASEMRWCFKHAQQQLKLARTRTDAPLLSTPTERLRLRPEEVGFFFATGGLSGMEES